MRFMEFFSIRDSDVLVGSLYEFLSELIFELCRSSIDLDVL